MATRHLPLRLTLQINLDDLDQTAPGGQHQHFDASYRTNSVDFRHSIQCRWCTKCFTKSYLQLFQPVHLVKFCTPVEFMFSVTVLQLWGLKLKFHTVCAGHQVTTDAIHGNNCFFLPETIRNLCYDFSKFVVTTKGTLEHHIYHEWHRSTWHPSVRFCFVLKFFGSGCSEHFSQIHDTSTLDCLVDTIPYSHQ